MFSKILIANRGEIALRIIRACKELGIRTVAVYSEVDKDSVHVEYADEAICIGPASPLESYLDIPRIISAAEIADVDAIHPGYGFLAENAHFAEICQSCGITFIGPQPESIRLMGDKIQARILAKKLGIPIVPGSLEPVDSKEQALEISRKMGYPVLIKAASGGGGKGMRICHSDVRLVSAFITAQSEAQGAFGDSKLYIEKLIADPKHIEVQIVADKYGRVLYFPERECSLQRRHQKLLEESPSVVVDAKLRKKIGEWAVKLSKSVNYETVGTVEFIMDKKRNVYFIEMNTRIQVEHPVTEQVTGVDLVRQQIASAAGEHLGLRQEDIKIQEHAMECRINCEDPDNNFLPSPGKVETLIFPGGKGVRLDTHLYQGMVVPPYYDSLIAKLITYGKNRKEVMTIMRRALDEFIVGPIKTTIAFHRKMLSEDEIVKGTYHTAFLKKFYREDAIEL